MMFESSGSVASHPPGAWVEELLATDVPDAHFLVFSADRVHLAAASASKNGFSRHKVEGRAGGVWVSMARETCQARSLERTKIMGVR
jgi:hypothetical protein